MLSLASFIMPNLAQKLASTLQPSSRPRTPRPTGDFHFTARPAVSTAKRPEIPASESFAARPEVERKPSFVPEPEASSKTCSSCELFGMFEALAAGKRDMSDFGGDLDSDEDEDDDSHVDLPGVFASEPESSMKTPEAQASDLSREREDSSNTIRRLSSSTPLQQWLDQTIVNTMQQRETLSARFTGKRAIHDQTDGVALSLSNISPYGEQVVGRKIRPQLPHVSSKPGTEYADSESELSESIPSTPSTGITTPPDTERHSAILVEGEEPSDERKLAAIVEEFGEIANLMERVDGDGSEPERMLAESKGSLFK